MLPFVISLTVVISSTDLFFFQSQDSLFIQPLLVKAIHASDHSMTSFTSPITSFVMDASGTNL